MTDNQKDKGIYQKAHEKGLAKAKSVMPKLDAVEVIKMALTFIKADTEEQKALLKKIALQYGRAGTAYAKSFAETAFNEYLKKSDNEYLNKLAKNNIGKDFVKVSEQVGGVVFDYIRGKQSADDLKGHFAKIELDNPLNKMVKAAGIDPKGLKGLDLNNVQLVQVTMAYKAFTKVYAMYQDALHDLALAKEERMRIEAECKECVDLIVSYREEMNALVSKFFSEHIETFQNGFELMDQAIMADDVDGYIAGNVEIQKILKSEIQFTNQEEFEALMLSDEAFKF